MTAALYAVLPALATSLHFFRHDVHDSAAVIPSVGVHFPAIGVQIVEICLLSCTSVVLTAVPRVSLPFC